MEESFVVAFDDQIREMLFSGEKFWIFNFFWEFCIHEAAMTSD